MIPELQAITTQPFYLYWSDEFIFNQFVRLKQWTKLQELSWLLSYEDYRIEEECRKQVTPTILGRKPGVNLVFQICLP